MRLRFTLDDYKRNRGDGTNLPGERRSTRGAFTGLDDRLVYVSEDGALRDYSYPLTGLSGLERSRFGVETADGHRWFESFPSVDQRYVGDTALVETRRWNNEFCVRQLDLSVGRGHVTRVELTGSPSADAALVAFLAFAPDGNEGQVGRLHHERAVETYHADERDYVAAATDAARFRGQPQETLGELLDEEPVEYPRGPDSKGDRRSEGGRLSSYVAASVPFEDGAATLVSLLTDAGGTDRGTALDRVLGLADEYAGAGPDALEAAAREQSPVGGEPRRTADRASESFVADRRVLGVLSADTGARVAGPDFDPFYEYSGGYGYTWFRDDAEISKYLLESDRRLETDLREFYEPNVEFYLETQRPDGSWPHRVWPHSGALAPGWANARLEGDGNGTSYQADQTASVVAFLARYLREREPDPGVAAEDGIFRGIESIDDTLEPDGLPAECQNAWENMTGRFGHTAGTFLAAYSAVARAPVDCALRDHAAERANRVYAGLDGLWSDDRACFGMGLLDGELDDRYDSATFALAGAHREYASVGALDAERVDRLVAHVESLCSGLARETDSIRGLVRFEGDDWRRRHQTDEKVWTVSTAWAANAATQVGLVLRSRGDERAPDLFDLAREHLTAVAPGGSLVGPNGYLSEQRFDDGTPDCATPLGWSHALRMATVATLADVGELASPADRVAER
jgi:glucoamylase